MDLDLFAKLDDGDGGNTAGGLTVFCTQFLTRPNGTDDGCDTGTTTAVLTAVPFM